MKDSQAIFSNPDTFLSPLIFVEKNELGCIDLDNPSVFSSLIISSQLLYPDRTKATPPTSAADETVRTNQLGRTVASVAIWNKVKIETIAPARYAMSL